MHFSREAAAGGTFSDLSRLFCRSAQEYFQASGAQYWEVTAPDSLVVAEAEGHLSERLRGSRIELRSSGVVSEAVRGRRTVYSRGPESADGALRAALEARALMAAPVVASGEVIGAGVFLHSSDPDFFTDELAAKATILAALLGGFAQAARLAHLSEQHRMRAEDLISLALELKPSLGLPDFVRRFTIHATEMLGARAAALALARSSQLETVFLHDPKAPAHKATLRQLDLALSESAGQHSDRISAGSGMELLGRAVAESLGWRDLALARLTGSDGELLGVLCLANRGRELSPADRNLLQALAGHASVTLENSRLFSRIEQSRKQWVEVFDAITDFIVVHDQNNGVSRVNRSLADFIGARPSELIGVAMRALLPILAEAGAQPCPFCRSGADPAEEHVHQAQERTYLVSTSRIRAGLDEDMQTIHVLKDITERREAERRYRELFDNIQEGLFFSTPDGRFLEVNDALVRMLGYNSREELLQADPAQQLYVWSQQRERFLKAIEKQGILRNYEEALRRKDGTIIHTLQNIFAVRDARGAIVQYRGVMLDISEQKTYQAQLQRERDFNRKILNNTQSMILVLDTAGLISYTNRRCSEAAYQEQDLLGHRLVEFVPAGRRQAFTDALQIALSGVQIDNLDLPIVRGDGRTAQFSLNLSPMRDEQGSVNSIVVALTDITDAASLQAQFVHREKMASVGQLVSGVAHEVNNPLTTILGFADLLLENPEIPESAKNDLRLVLHEAQRTKVIVQNLLSFARQMPAQREPIEINAILRQTLQLRSYDFSSHGVDVVERLAEALPKVIGDSHQLQQVFLNILNNAYDAVRETSRPGRIEIETACRAGFAEVFFRDNGPGISFPDRIFDPFFTTKEVGKGTGLGLSICYGIVREHGGEITCYNNAGAEGCTFIVRLPIATRTAPLAAAEVTR